MQLSRRKVVLFGLYFLPLLAVLAMLYPRILPGYHDFLLGAANPFARSFSPPLQIEKAEEGAWRIFRLEPGGEQKRVFSIPGKSLEQIHMSLILLPALLLATPVGIRSRLGLLAAGLGLLVLLQVASHLLFVWAWVQYQDTDPQNPFYKLIVVSHSTAGQVYPVVLWGLITWRYWLPRPATPVRVPIAEPVGRNQPCPCGSGRRYKRCCGAPA